MNLEDQSAHGWSRPDIVPINLAPLGHLNGTRDAIRFGQGLPFLQSFFEVNSRIAGPLNYFAARCHATLRSFKPVQVQARIAIEFADSVLAPLIGAVDREGDEVVDDQLDVLL